MADCFFCKTNTQLVPYPSNQAQEVRFVCPKCGKHFVEVATDGKVELKWDNTITPPL